MANAEQLSAKDRDKEKARPEFLPPKDAPPSETVQRLIARGRPAHAIVDYPRFDEAGEPICKVFVRLLTVQEQDMCLANARAHSARLCRGTEGYDQKPEEIEANARITEILAIALRDEADPEKPFFVHGSPELRMFSHPSELGVLFNVYAKIMQRTTPRLREMNAAEMDAWLNVIAEGLMEYPFAYCSREDLETLCEHAAKSSASKGQPGSGMTSTASSTPD